MSRQRINFPIKLEGYHEPFLETVSWSQNVQMHHNGTVETRPALRTFLGPSTLPIQITLPPGIRCVPYSYQFEQASIYGLKPLVWSASGLPGCMTFSAGGLLGGTPCQAGTFLPQITVSNASGNTVRFKCQIVIADVTPQILLPGET
jgi:hypothetical protein